MPCIRSWHIQFPILDEGDSIYHWEFCGTMMWFNERPNGHLLMNIPHVCTIIFTRKANIKDFPWNIYVIRRYHSSRTLNFFLSFLWFMKFRKYSLYSILFYVGRHHYTQLKDHLQKNTTCFQWFFLRFHASTS